MAREARRMSLFLVTSMAMVFAFFPCSRAEEAMSSVSAANRRLQDGLTLANSGKSEAAIAAFGELFLAHRNDENPELRRNAASAMGYSSLFNLIERRNADDAIRDLDAIIAAFKDDPDADVRVAAASAFLQKAHIYEIKGMLHQRMSLYDELFSLFGNERGRRFARVLGRAALDKGRMQVQSGDAAGALQTYDQVLPLFAENVNDLSSEELRWQIANARKEVAQFLEADEELE